jgi:hypothetical protein
VEVDLGRDFEVGALKNAASCPNSLYCCSVGSINAAKLVEGGSQAFDELLAIRSRTELALIVMREQAAERGAVAPEERETR